MQDSRMIRLFLFLSIWTVIPLDLRCLDREVSFDTPSASISQPMCSKPKKVSDESCIPKTCAEAQSVKFNLQGDIGYFLPKSRRFRQIYSGGLFYSLDGSYKFARFTYAWANVSLFPKKGHTLGIKYDTTILMVPIVLGFKFRCTLNRFNDQIYLGIGGATCYVHMDDKDPFLIQKRVNWTFGGAAKAGYLLHVWKPFFVDLFVSYQYLAPVSFKGSSSPLVYGDTVDLSGLSAGGGISFDF